MLVCCCRVVVGVGVDEGVEVGVLMEDGVARVACLCWFVLWLGLGWMSKGEGGC